jgi:hypothetical protein
LVLGKPIVLFSKPIVLLPIPIVLFSKPIVLFLKFMNHSTKNRVLVSGIMPH